MRNVYFKPIPRGFPDNTPRVQPDILPKGSVRINAVWINGRPYDNFDAARRQGATGILLNMTELSSISSEALRYIIFTKQNLGSSFDLSITGANLELKTAIEMSELNEEVHWL